MTNKKLWFVLMVGIAALSLVLAGCSASDDDNGDGDDGGIVDPGLEVATCEGCHTSEEMLKATVEEEPPAPESEGEG
jgi:hypothetical protein